MYKYKKNYTINRILIGVSILVCTSIGIFLLLSVYY